jgi:hypothetical protein
VVSWVWAEVTPSVTTMLDTYWCRIGSVDCFQAGLRASVIDVPGLYEVILYGPSEIVFWSSCRLFGTKASYSAGRAEANGMAMMLRKSLAGWTRLMVSVVPFADSPEMVWLFWNFAMLAAVGAFDLLAKNAVSALQ